MARLFVGTSGWNYAGWRGALYPEALPSRGWFAHYVRQFNSVELNYSFYRLPRSSSYETWAAQMPPGFEMAVTVSRLITQAYLSNVDARWPPFVQSALALGEKLGPFLAQLPPSFSATPERLERLEHFLEVARQTPSARVAVEFRHESWFEKNALDLLRRTGAALVLAQSSRFPTPAPLATGPFVYFCFHGPREWCASSYSDAELRDWAVIIERFLEERRDVYVYFNNDNGGHAPRNAQTLADIVARKGKLLERPRQRPAASQRQRSKEKDLTVLRRRRRL